MARFTLLPFLAILLLVAHTCCSFKWPKPSCSKQLQKVNLKPCEKHVMEKIQPEEEEDEDEEQNLKLRGRFSYLNKRDEEEDNEQKCCSELQELNNEPTCQCRALQKIFDNQSERLQKQEKDRLKKELKNLVERCELPLYYGCDLQCEED